MKKKTVFFIVGILLAFLPLIPPLPGVLKILLPVIPIIFFGFGLLFSYIKEVLKKNFINTYLIAIIGTAGLICTGRLAYAAMTTIFFSAAITIFNDTYKKELSRIDKSRRIMASRAMLITDDKLTRVKASELLPGQTISIKQGDLIAADGIVSAGEIEVDYTNVFGPSEPTKIKTGEKCYSGGIVVYGKAALNCQRTAKDCFAAKIDKKTKEAQTPSKRHLKLLKAAKIYEPIVAILAVIMFIALYISTKDLAKSMNIAVVLLFAAPTLGMTTSLSLLYHNTLITARSRGALFASETALEELSRIQTLSPNEKISSELLSKIEQTGVVPAKNASEERDAALYRTEQAMSEAPSDVYKIALGFFSDNAKLTLTDGHAQRVTGALRSARDYKSVMWQNALCLIIEKLILIALAFILHITPAAAVVIEFAAWMICLLNASRSYFI